MELVTNPKALEEMNEQLSALETQIASAEKELEDCRALETTTPGGLKVPVANNGAASLISFYYGEDSPFTTLGQETLHLKQAMDGYDYVVLLKHDSLPWWADLSEADERLADVIDVPTQANLFKYLIQLAEDGFLTDVYLFHHGVENGFKVSQGTDGTSDYVYGTDILNELDPSKTGFTQMAIRMVYGQNCYGQTLGETWRSVGAKTTAGARKIRYYPNAFGPFIDEWNKGNVSFHDAVHGADTDAVRTVVQTWISMVDAPAKKLAGDWGGCSLGKTVLGDDPCAKDYFVSCWFADDWWQEGLSGKDNMNYSSFMFTGGEKEITKNTIPRW
jgi:hypothetical protein